MSAALLLEEQQASVVGGQAVSVVYRPEAVDLSGWPTTGAWSRVRRDPKTGVSVPLLRVPELDRRSFHRLAALGAARGVLSGGELHLAQWLQDDIGLGGAIAWTHEDLSDYADHYAHYTSPAKPRKCSACTFWRRLRVLREGVGLVWHLEPASKGSPARYEVCVRADSPLLVNVPEDLAAALHLDVLARLLGEHEVPVSTEPERAPLTQIAELYGGAQLLPEQHADAQALSRLGAYEIALIHARSPEQEDVITRAAIGSSRGWVDPQARPIPRPVSQTPDGDVPDPEAPRELALPGRPLPSALRADLTRLTRIKRTVIQGIELTPTRPVTSCKTSPITVRGLSYQYGFDFRFPYAREAQRDGRSTPKAAPTARNINGELAFGPAADARPVAQEGPGVGPVGTLRARHAPFDLGEGERVARQVWAIWRARRPRETLLGHWTTGPDGLAVWEAGEGWDELVLLIARCLRRTAESAVIKHAVDAISPSSREPVKVLAKRLWKIARSDTYEHRRDISKPADYVLQEDLLTPAEQAASQRARYRRQHQSPDAVRLENSSAAEELAAAQERLRAQRGQRRQAEQAAAASTAARPRREFVDESAAPFIPRPSLEEITRGLAELATQSEPAAPAEAWEIAPEAARRVGADAAAARAARAGRPEVAPASHLSGEQSHAAAAARKQTERQAAAKRTRSAAAQAAIDQIRPTKGRR